MATHAEIKMSIMRRVHRIAFMRKAYHSSLTKVFVLAIFGITESIFVSYSHVVSNAEHVLNFRAFLHFSKVAFLNTELGAQIIILGSVFFIFLLMLDIARSLASGKIFGRLQVAR